jgi:hypothetical protein
MANVKLTFEECSDLKALDIKRRINETNENSLNYYALLSTSDR